MGVVVSFSKVSLANDNEFSVDPVDNILGIVFLDVMSNDLGGKAKSLWSLDDGTSASDLLAQDTARTEELTNDRSAFGARIWITADGNVGYDAGTIDASHFIGVAPGESITDTFTYAIRLGNGTLSWATVTVHVYAPEQPNRAPELAVVVPIDYHDTSAFNVFDPQTGTLSATDADGDTLTFGIAGGTEDGSLEGYNVSKSSDYGTLYLNSATGTYTFVPADAAINALKLTVITDFTLTVSDGALTDSRILTLTHHGVNDAPTVANPVVTGGEVLEHSGPFTITAADLLQALGAHDVDGDTLRIINLQGRQVDANGDEVSVPGNVDVIVNPYGSLSHLIFRPDTFESLAKDELLTLVGDFDVSDGDNGVVHGQIRQTLIGENDAPQIAGGPVDGLVEEDSIFTANGQLVAFDPDHGARRMWTVDGGTAPQFPDYHFLLDAFQIVRNGMLFYEDEFDNGLPPPSGGVFFNNTIGSYSIPSGLVTESDGRAVLDGEVFPNPFAIGAGAGHFVALNTDISNDLTRGLKLTHDFTVAGRFDLIVPEPGQVYGIRVTDDAGPSHPGNDIVQLLVQAEQSGGIFLGFAILDFVNLTNTQISSLPVMLAPGDDQIELRLTHDADNPGVITASYALLSNGVETSSGVLDGFGQIFGTATPSDLSDDEVWTRAQFVAGQVVSPFSVRDGIYGTLSVDQNGHWTYVLHNGDPVVQALAQNQVEYDSFSVRVTDEWGAFDYRDIVIDVQGTNDEPDIVGAQPGVDGFFGEQFTLDISHPGQMTIGDDFDFADVDLLDGHTVTWQRQSVSFPGPQLGVFNVSFDDTSAGVGGRVDWSYTVDPSTWPFGTIHHEYFTVTVADFWGGKVEYVIDVAYENLSGGGDPPPPPPPPPPPVGSTSVSNFMLIDYQGGINTQALGINNLGQIVGQSIVAGQQIGWLYGNGSFGSPISFEGNTTARGINDLEVIAGMYEPGGGRFGYTLDDGIFSGPISLPPHTSTDPNDINDFGVIVGSSFQHAGTTYSAFVLDGANAAYLTAPGSTNTRGGGLNNDGDVVGFYDDLHGFLYRDGGYTTIDHPQATQGTFLVDINNAGQIVGWYTSGGTSHGLLYTNGVFTPVEHPDGVNGTVVVGLNDAGQLVGYYVDDFNISHGFVANIGNPVDQPTDDVLVARPNGGTLVGGFGDDIFVFNAPPATPPTIADFALGDTLQINALGFWGELSSQVSLSVVNDSPNTASDPGTDGYFIFHNESLYWDATGGMGSDAGIVAYLPGVTSLALSDFHIV